MAEIEITLPSNRLKTIIRSAVRDELRELLDDPDFGLVVRPEFLAEMVRSQRDRKAGRVFNLDDISRGIDIRS